MVSNRDSLRRWLEHPQRAPGRALLFQIHLWLGLALAAYIVVISVSGSAVVFRRELNAWLVPRSLSDTSGFRLEGDALLAAVEAAYPGYEILKVSDARAIDRPLLVKRARRGVESERLFDPYTGSDLGDVFPPAARALEWLVRLHDNLLMGSSGRRVNGIASVLVGALVFSGSVLWWPGRSRWRRSLSIPRPSRTRRLLWHIHSAVGFWSSSLLLVWIVTGFYFGFPGLFEELTSGTIVDGRYVASRGEALLLELIALHFGRFGGLEIRVLWTLLGLVPAVLVVTGVIVWWRRTQRRYAHPQAPPSIAHQARALANGPPNTSEKAPASSA